MPDATRCGTESRENAAATAGALVFGGGGVQARGKSLVG